jgi:hypothetical protein
MWTASDLVPIALPILISLILYVCMRVTAGRPPPPTHQPLREPLDDVEPRLDEIEPTPPVVDGLEEPDETHRVVDEVFLRVQTALEEQTAQLRTEIQQQVTSLHEQNTQIRTEVQPQLTALHGQTAQLQQRVVQLTETLSLQLQAALSAAEPRSDILYQSTFSPAQPMCGLIAWLGGRAGGNTTMTHTGCVRVRGSSAWDEPGRNPEKILDESPNTYYHSAGRSGQWVMIDFSTVRVRPTYCTLLSRRDFDRDNRNLKSWVLEGSNVDDVFSWIQLASERNQSALNGRGKCYSFPVEAKRGYRFIRLRSTGPAWGPYDGLVIAGLELFGQLLTSQ